MDDLFELDEIFDEVISCEDIKEVDGELDEQQDDVMQENIALVQMVLDEMDLHYKDFWLRHDVYIFEVDFRYERKKFKMKIYLESHPYVCRIDAVLPFPACQEFEYPLCQQLMKESYPRRYGSLKYDENDGEITVEYSFKSGHGIHADEFKCYFAAVHTYADESYGVIQRLANGRICQPERDHIICKAQQLIIELSGETLAAPGRNRQDFQ